MPKVLRVVNAGSNFVVVGMPFVSVHAAVSVSVREVGEEIKENFVLGEFSRNHLGVDGRSVDSLKVSGID